MKRKSLSGKAKGLIAGAAVFLFMLLIALFINILNLGRLSSEMKAHEAEINRLAAEESYIKDEITRLQDPEYIDAYAREKLDMKKKDDVVYRGE